MIPTKITSVMRAVVVQKDHTVAVEERPTPELEINEILVKVEAVAQNPTDWKHVLNVPQAAGKILGCDFSGTVVRMSDGCKGHVSIGDHVAGFTEGGYYEDRGAFATYLKVDSDLVWAVPEKTLSHYEAATMGCAVSFTGNAWRSQSRLYERNLKHGYLFMEEVFAIQLAHVAGYKIATVASTHNHEFVKSLGADVVLDYKSSGILAEIQKATEDKVQYAFDTIVTNESQILSVNAIRPTGGKIVLLEKPLVSHDELDLTKIRQDVEVRSTMIYTVLGRPIDLGGYRPAAPEERAHMANFLLKLPQLVKSGQIRPNKVRLWEGGLDSVGDGLQFMIEGKVSAEKIVYKV